MGQSGLDSFISYLREKQRLDRAERPASSTGGTALSVLRALADTPGRSVELTQLQAAGGMSFVDFAEAVKRLRDSGYLTISGQPGRETAELTRLGEDVAELTRSR